MTKTENKREEKKRKVIMPAGIRNKLVAAISMLMVASIMMVSSTYAWFTLSTAPEVKGITTNVGANGNLEMMLLNKTSFTSSAEDLSVVSDINDSMATKPVTVANRTWGNLVDLADQSYGLQSIVINPARLNIQQGVDGSYTMNSTLLKAPTYTSDGRVLDVDKDTLTSGYSTDNTWKWDETAENAYGVRVIGTTSGVTVRLTAYRAAISERTAQIEAAKTFARQSLLEEGQGQALANIIVKAALGNEEGFSVDEMKTLMKLIDKLQESNNAAGEAIVQTVLAYNLGSANIDAGFTDADVPQLKAAFDGKKANEIPATYTHAEGSTANGTITKPEGTDTAVTKWISINTNIEAARTELQAKIDAGAKVNADEIMGIVSKLIDKTHTTVADVQNPGKKDADAIVQYLSAHNMILDIVMEQGSGAYADIAELVGDYTASGLKVFVEYGSLKTSVTTNMSTKVVTEATSTTLPMIPKLNVGSAPAATLDASVKPLLTDHFGYALDFGFRTNAAASSLLLQTEGIQRVYNDATDPGESAKTQGGGSYMQFTTSNTTNFSIDELRALMSALRVVFVEPNISTDNTVTYNVLGVAAADITATTNDDGATYTYTGGTLLKDGAALPEGTTDGANGVKVNLYLYNYTYDNGTSSITLNGKKVKAEGEGGTATPDNTLTALTQNVGKKVTAIVYLDGDKVDNTMVANAQNSMTGMLNLQFASSATLKPMDNTGMRNGGADANTVNVTYTQEKVAGEFYTKEINGTTYTITVNEGYTIYKGSDDNYYYEYNNSKNYVQFTEKGILTCRAFTIKTN